MTIDRHVLHAERFDQIGSLIQRDTTILIERWQRRALQEQPNAPRVHLSTLLDHLPLFLVTLGQSLAESNDVETSPHCQPARAHGEQRWESGWSLTEVVRDYQILRLVILEYLEETLDRPVSYREVMAVGLSLDEAIAASVDKYIRHRDEQARQDEGRFAEQDRKAQEALHRWQHIFENVGWGVAIADPATHALQSVNSAFARMHGCSVAELMGKSLADVLAPESQAELAQQATLADDNSHAAFEAVHLRKDGHAFPVLTQVTAFKDQGGKVLFRAFSFQDITEIKRLEGTLRQQAEALRQADRRKDEFMAVLAHELRNPLAPILNYLSVLRLLQPTAGPDIQQAHAVIERQVRQMKGILEDLLDITRISQGRVQLRQERLDVATVVEQAVQTCEPLVKGRRHHLSVSLPAQPLWIEGDPTRLVQVLVNLVNNAAKYTEPGGQIQVTGASVANRVEIRVRDNGMGIPPNMLGQVFDMFTQVDRSKEHAQGGLGIGLAMVRRLVELHGGEVTAHSAGPGQGSEFMVCLSTSTSAPEEGPAAGKRLLNPVAARHILVVEDDPDGRQSLATLLRLQGHRIDVAADGRQGVERALALRPQVALIDLGLPVMDGFKVAQQVRAALGKSIFIVALTGYGQPDDRQKTQEAGFDAYLLKPIELEKLAHLLANVTASLPLPE